MRRPAEAHSLAERGCPSIHMSLMLLIGSGARVHSVPLTRRDYKSTWQVMQVTLAVLLMQKGISITGAIPAGSYVEAYLRGPSFPARRFLSFAYWVDKEPRHSCRARRQARRTNDKSVVVPWSRSTPCAGRRSRNVRSLPRSATRTHKSASRGCGTTLSTGHECPVSVVACHPIMRNSTAGAPNAPRMQPPLNLPGEVGLRS